jgi:hypothetical protein
VRTTKLPAYCHANVHGQVQVTYQAATTRGTGSDTLTAALDPFGTGQATDQYTYAASSTAKVVSLSWELSPIAPPGTLPAARGKMTVSLVALAGHGAPVPSASVDITFTPAPGSNATLSGKGCTGTGTDLHCRTDSTGHVTLTYTSASAKLRGGSDALQATTSPVPGSPTAVDTYTYVLGLP